MCNKYHPVRVIRTSSTAVRVMEVKKYTFNSPVVVKTLPKKSEKNFQLEQAKQLFARPDMQCGGNLRKRRNAACGSFFHPASLMAANIEINWNRRLSSSYGKI